MSKILTSLLLILTSFQLFAGQNIDRLIAAANQGNGQAAYQVARAFDTGKGIEQDKANAIVWYEKAAMLNEPTAQVALGLKYAIGETTPKDMEMAYVWFKVAEQNGHQVGERYRIKAEKELTPNQLASALEKFKRIDSELINHPAP